VLAGHLPNAMIEDPFLQRFIRIFDDVAASVHLTVDSIPHQFDIGLAEGPVLDYVAGWLDLVLDPDQDLDTRRESLRCVIDVLGWRGTRRGLEGAVTAILGRGAVVRDRGGVFLAGELLPPQDPDVEVEVGSLLGMTESQVLSVLADDVPVGARLRFVAGPSGDTGGDPDGR